MMKEIQKKSKYDSLQESWKVWVAVACYPYKYEELNEWLTNLYGRLTKCVEMLSESFNKFFETYKKTSVPPKVQYPKVTLRNNLVNTKGFSSLPRISSRKG